MLEKRGDIRFHYLVKPFFFPHRTDAKTFIRKIFRQHHKKIDTINYVFCSDKYLLSINQKYLNHSYLTDIITFDLSETERITADVFISVETMQANALAYEVSRTSETIRLLIHGALHLCGYKDKTLVEFKKMKSLEEYYIQKFFVSRETQNKI